MRNLILDGGPIQTAFEAGQDATVLTLLNTATETVIVNAHVDVDVIVAAESESFAGDFIRTLNARIAALNATTNPDPALAEEDRRLAAILNVYVVQLAGDGINLTDQKVRNKITAALQAQGGWNAGKRNRILNLGSILKSKPQVHYGRDAVQADIDELRAELARNALRAEWDAAFNAHVSAAMDNGDRAGVAAGLVAMAAEFDD